MNLYHLQTNVRKRYAVTRTLAPALCAGCMAHAFVRDERQFGDVIE
jgi:hypothetical protein